MPFTDYKSVPFVSGDASIIRTILRNAPTAFQRIAMFGDSQETDPTGGGTSLGNTMNSLAHRLYGVQAETRIHPFSSSGSGSPTNYWCCSGSNAGAVAGALAANRYLPNISTGKTSGTNTGQINNLQVMGDANFIVTALRDNWYPFASQAGMVAELFAFAEATGPDKIIWRNLPTTSAAVNYFVTQLASGISGALGLDSSSLALIKFTTPAIAQDLAKTYTQLHWQGVDTAGTTVLPGLNVVGMRFKLAHNSGLLFDSFSAGGYTSASVLASHGSAGPMLSGFGPWSAVSIHYGCNDATSGHSATTFEANQRALIAAIRGSSWLNSVVPIILVCDPETASIEANGTWLAEFDQFAGVQEKIAQDTPGVVAINLRRALRQIGYVATTGIWTIDGTHGTQLGQTVKATVLWSALLSTVSSAASGATSQTYDTVERSTADTKAITFSWPTSTATITGQVSKDRAAYAAVQGAIAFLRSDGTKHWYTLAYDADDRPTTEGTALYKFTDGTRTVFVPLRVEGSAGGGAGTATIEKQNEILAKLAAAVIRHNPVISQSELELLWGADYNGTEHEKAEWGTEKDYTGYTITLTVWRPGRNAAPDVLLTATGAVDSAVLVSASFTAVFLSAINFTGKPPKESVRFDVIATKAGKRESIATGECCILQTAPAP